jgi:hypothetical protein
MKPAAKFKKNEYALYGNKPYLICSLKWDKETANYVYTLKNLLAPVFEFELTKCDNF